MNTAELTELHTETIAAVNLSRTLANISRRAATLFTRERLPNGGSVEGSVPHLRPAGQALHGDVLPNHGL